MWLGNCPGCGKIQESIDKIEVDIKCWDCSVNANIERNDIIQDIKKALENPNNYKLHAGLSLALQIVKKYER